MRKMIVFLFAALLAMPAGAQILDEVEMYLGPETNYDPLPFGGADRAIGALLYTAEVLRTGDFAEVKLLASAPLLESDSPFGTQIDVCTGHSTPEDMVFFIPYDLGLQGYIQFLPLEGGLYKYWYLQWTGDEPGRFTIGYATKEDGFFVPDDGKVKEVFVIQERTTPTCSRHGGKRMR